MTAQRSLIPDLSQERRNNTETDNGIDNEPNTKIVTERDTNTNNDLVIKNDNNRNIKNDNNINTNTYTESGVAVQLELARRDLANLQSELAENKATLNSVQNQFDSIAKEKAQLEDLVKRLEAEKSALQAELDLPSGASHTLQAVLDDNENLKQQVASLTQQLDAVREAIPSDSSRLVEEFAIARVMKQVGFKKKGDTYTQTGFYQDHDVQERLKKYLENIPYDKSTVINAALDHLLSRLGY